jgi:hypothetical protein
MSPQAAGIGGHVACCAYARRLAETMNGPLTVSRAV